MTSWAEAVSHRLSGGRIEQCDAGHAKHQTVTVDTVQGPMRVFAADRYQDIHGYCTGDDQVSRSLAASGVWEPHIYAGLATLGVLDDAQLGEHVIDFGSHVGWYTRLAVNAGFTVVAVDGEPEHLSLTVRNAGTDVITARGWLDCDSKFVTVPDDDSTVRLVKADVEGAERHAVRTIEPLLDAGLVDHLLLEISPVFNDTYHVLCTELVWRGFRAWRFDPLREWDWRLDFPQTEILFSRS